MTVEKRLSFWMDPLELVFAPDGVYFTFPLRQPPRDQGWSWSHDEFESWLEVINAEFPKIKEQP